MRVTDELGLGAGCSEQPDLPTFHGGKASQPSPRIKILNFAGYRFAAPALRQADLNLHLEGFDEK